MKNITLNTAINRAAENLVSIQNSDGSWTGEYGGPMFLLPMYVAACKIAGHEVPEKRRNGIATFLGNIQNTDGSIGLHEEGPGCMFTTVLNYCALRFIEVPPTNPLTTSMREWILANGTALGCASWGKFMLSVLNLYSYDGIHPILPELLLLPRSVPIHPGHMWCHARLVYLPMAYLYGTRTKIAEDDLIREIRDEIYSQPYESIKFSEHRDTISSADNIVPPSQLLNVANKFMDMFESTHVPALRRRALDLILEHIAYEDRETHFIRIGPVNAVLNTLVHHFREPGGEGEKKSFRTLDKYLWESDSETKMNGYNNTALWDTSFSTQSLLAAKKFLQPAKNYSKALFNAHEFIRDNQILEDPPEMKKYFRNPAKGGWPFSDREHSWPITDCTAEGFKCSVALEKISSDPVPEDLLESAIHLILNMQNKDGGWASYENTRSGRWLESLNPSYVFSEIMVDISYVECTSSCIQALSVAREKFAHKLGKEIDTSIRAGAKFIRDNQRPDGSFEGSWGVCFTYGTWFGVTGLRSAGIQADDPAILNACEFLKSVQNRDGGWGEHFSSCTERMYIKHKNSQVVNTAWALLALVNGGQGNSKEARRAADFLVKTQMENGDWPRQAMSGVFNKTTLINYDNYRRYFPLWALAEYKKYATEKIGKIHI